MLTDEQRTRISTLLGDAKDVTDDNAVTVLLSYAEHVTTEYTDAAAKVTELSNAEPAAPAVVGLSANEKALLIDSAESAIELSAIKHNWPQAFTNAVTAFVKKDDGILLSRDAGNNSRFKELLGLLAEYPLKGLSALSTEQTGAQSLTLSRHVPGGHPAGDLATIGQQQADAIVAKRLKDRGIATA